ncbi:MAG: dihydrodipicolinate synthase family protein [Prosthecobacter sp.]|uniref:dihydrodipicolinate synthase family protein n=1 Tax=Prosthecobacter sp. TaxID=1965333 RepID=UPI00390152E6
MPRRFTVMMNLPDSQRLHGLVTATHTPFHADGSLNLDVVEKQAAFLLSKQVTTVFIGGSTGESHSLTFDERHLLAKCWMAVTKGTAMRVVVHVGSNCLADAKALAEQAEELGAAAIAALTPMYFKPKNVEVLVETMAQIAAAAPETPFYYYDIPVLTGVSHSMPEFLKQAKDRIPTLAGIKFTNSDLMSYQYCLRADGGIWDVPFGFDEHMLGALAMGAKGAVGSGFNFAAPIYTRLLAAFAKNDFAAAREEQFRGVQIITLLASYGYMGAAKAVMAMLGVDVGPARLPNTTLTAPQKDGLHGELEAMGFFEWVG